MLQSGNTAKLYNRTIPNKGSQVLIDSPASTFEG